MSLYLFPVAFGCLTVGIGLGFGAVVGFARAREDRFAPWAEHFFEARTALTLLLIGAACLVFALSAEAQP